MEKNLIRQENLKLIRQITFEKESFTANDLVQVSKISKVTIQSILKEMLENQEIRERQLINQAKGRPALQYEFSYDYQHYLLLAILEKQPKILLNMQLVQMNGEIIEEKEVDFTSFSEKLLLDCIKEFTRKDPKVKKIALMVPGKVYQGKIISGWGNNVMEAWAVQEGIQSFTNAKIVLQNDAHVITLGYCQKHRLQNETIVGIYFPEKSMPGITILSEKGLFEGNRSLAGEAKFLPEFSQQGRPETTHEFGKILKVLLPIYNVVVAPSRFVIASNTNDLARIKKDLASNEFIKQQPNQPLIQTDDNYLESVKLGLLSLIQEMEKKKNGYGQTKSNGSALGRYK